MLKNSSLYNSVALADDTFSPSTQTSGAVSVVSLARDGEALAANADYLAESEAPETAEITALELAKRTYEKALHRVKAGDCAAPFDAEVLEALSLVQSDSLADYQRCRASFKKADNRVQVNALDKAVTRVKSKGRPVALTHNGYASDLLARLTVVSHRPVGHEGGLYVVDPATSLWKRKEFGSLVRLISEAHDGSPNCTRSTDYTGVARHAVLLADNNEFFAKAPMGLACPDAFYRVVGNRFSKVPLTPDHRQRVRIDVIPSSEPTPLFDQFLHETFKSPVEGEEEQQKQLMQEIAGAMLLGLMPTYQKAVLFYDPYGRAGKGTMERILRGLVPAEFVKAVSPFDWNKEYYLANLMGARLNVVGELPQGTPIPAAQFKSVIGGDLITGRNPGGIPISYKNEAAHIFMSNYLIGTTDQSEAFYSRWLIVEFPNSRVKSGEKIDSDLPQRIIDGELAAIGGWALAGAERLLERGKFSESMVQDRMLARWRRSANSLDDFIDECYTLEKGANPIRRGAFYKDYVTWCNEGWA